MDNLPQHIQDVRYTQAQYADAALLSGLASRDVSVVFRDPGKPGVHMSNLSVICEAGIKEGRSGTW